MNGRTKLHLAALAGWLAAVPTPAEPATNAPAPDKIPYTRPLERIQQTVATLRGKKFLRTVPAFKVTAREMNAIVARDVDKTYPGQELDRYQALLVWLDMLPPSADLKSAERELFVGAAAGFYDTETKEMCIPSFSWTRTNTLKQTAEKTAGLDTGLDDDIVFAHEFTHALEDQYWPLDDPLEIARQESTDRGEARDFLAEGSATRLMIEALPALSVAADSPRAYPVFWNVLHSDACEFGLEYLLRNIWKSSDALVPGVPDQLARAETMEYSYGYSFCARVMRDWGLDGLDYFCEHPPASTAQIIHPAKAWVWRAVPMQITLPPTLSNDWKQVSGECLGEAGLSVVLGCAFKNLNRGTQLAEGWDGDRAALYEAPNGRRLLVWASAWDSDLSAAAFADAWLKERRALHQAGVVRQSREAIEWTQPDGRAGWITRDNRRVLIFETDQAAALAGSSEWGKAIRFTQPPQNAVRDSANHTLLRINPVLSWQQDADYTLGRALWGLLFRHDRNSVGVADSCALGLVGERRRTATFNKWQVGWSSIAHHESDTRRGVSKTGLLPCSLLYSEFTAQLPPTPDQILAHKSVLWGLAFSQTQVGADEKDLSILPFGLLVRSHINPTRTATYVLGTGISRGKTAFMGQDQIQFRLFGVRVWSRR